MAWNGREPEEMVPPNASMMFRIELIELSEAGS
jgi:FKBP-type peptidyl-prolyl cis-trans isomerase